MWGAGDQSRLDPVPGQGPACWTVVLAPGARTILKVRGIPAHFPWEERERLEIFHSAGWVGLRVAFPIFWAPGRCGGASGSLVQGGVTATVRREAGSPRSRRAARPLQPAARSARVCRRGRRSPRPNCASNPRPAPRSRRWHHAEGECVSRDPSHGGRPSCVLGGGGGPSPRLSVSLRASRSRRLRHFGGTLRSPPPGLFLGPPVSGFQGTP